MLKISSAVELLYFKTLKIYHIQIHQFHQYQNTEHFDVYIDEYGYIKYSKYDICHIYDKNIMKLYFDIYHHMYDGYSLFCCKNRNIPIYENIRLYFHKSKRIILYMDNKYRYYPNIGNDNNYSNYKVISYLRDIIIFNNFYI